MAYVGDGLNASKVVSRLVEATMTRGSLESREAPDKVVCLPMTLRFFARIGRTDVGSRLPRGAQ
jgi:hypothetical protein